ncbi:hypothetical protein EDB86DRAFT_75656 [Lactarius hatsudake]|nr:hypothetical protein EDB86DRAFT_75656 [Lactarius hatsudake]
MRSTMNNLGRIRATKDVAVQSDAPNVQHSQRHDPLDRQLADAEALVLKLRQRMNERALVSRLPVEILIQIFSYCPASDLYPHVRHRPPPPWLAVTHVCRRWRNAALSCPSLWVEIISTNFEWTAAMLERSKDLPIHVSVDDGGSAQMPCELSTARLLFTKIHRMQSLAMTCAHAIIACVPMLFEAKAAPLLQELIITNFHPSHPLDLVARPLFSGETPNLQFLSLYRCRVLWSSPLLQCDLVYLSISHVPPDQRPYLGQVLQVLKRLTRLECLQLDEALPVHITSPNETTSSILSVERLPLAHLRFFSLCARSALDILDFSASVLIPATALFQLICEEFEQYAPDTDSGDVMLAALASHICAPRDTASAVADATTSGDSNADTWVPIRSVHVRDIPAARSWSLFASAAHSADDDGDACDTSPPDPADEQARVLSLHMRWSAHPAGARAAICFIERAARLPPLARAHKILIESALFSHGCAWRSAFVRSQHVKAVFAGGDSAVAGAAQMLLDVARHEGEHRNEGLQHLQPAAAVVPVATLAAEVDAEVYAAIARLLPSSLAFARPAGELPRTLFPKLKRLTIAGADLWNADAGLFESLCAGLAARKGCEGAALAQLAVRRCAVRQEQVNALGNFIGESKVIWDGVLRGPPRSLPVNVGPDHVTPIGEGSEWPSNLEEVGTEDGEEDYHDLILVGDPNLMSLPGPGESVVAEENDA